MKSFLSENCSARLAFLLLEHIMMEIPSRISRLETLFSRNKNLRRRGVVSADFFEKEEGKGETISRTHQRVPDSIYQTVPDSIPPPCTRFSPIEIASLLIIIVLGSFALIKYPQWVYEESIRSESLWRGSSFAALSAAANDGQDCESAYILGVRYLLAINGSTIINIELAKKFLAQAFAQCSCYTSPGSLLDIDRDTIYPSFLHYCKSVVQ
jgi:hypothetical protein